MQRTLACECENPTEAMKQWFLSLPAWVRWLFTICLRGLHRSRSTAAAQPAVRTASTAAEHPAGTDYCGRVEFAAVGYGTC